MQDFLGNGLGPTNGLVVFPLETYVTDPIDLTLVTPGIEIIPAKPGHVPFLVGSTWIIEKASGTQTSPPTVQGGTNAAHNNVFTSNTSPANADVTGATPPSISAGVGAAIPSPAAVTANLPVIMDITAGATGTGTFAVVARLSVTIAWFAEG